MHPSENEALHMGGGGDGAQASDDKEDAGRALTSVPVGLPFAAIVLAAGIPIFVTGFDIRGHDYTALFNYLEYVFPFYAALIGGHRVYEEKLKKENPRLAGYAVACFKAAVLFLCLGLLSHVGGHFTQAGGTLHVGILCVIFATLAVCAIWALFKGLETSSAPFVVPICMAVFLLLVFVVFPFLLS
ncbi:hypothetical protein [Pandoraea fibrosis]|uniref:Transmembrane protein n=1 Tax=Pandoraea fibrosis TaxID=1891094 RepID=A0A5E4T281_9BURK|nr:hypothetical protein [Pandoraea fibrosis]VVD80544.1 hypothetical protein PFI31113_01086 [Pandoraea fibrosis]